MCLSLLMIHVSQRQRTQNSPSKNKCENNKHISPIRIVFESELSSCKITGVHGKLQTLRCCDFEYRAALVTCRVQYGWKIRTYTDRLIGLLLNQFNQLIQLGRVTCLVWSTYLDPQRQCRRHHFRQLQASMSLDCSEVEFLVHSESPQSIRSTWNSPHRVHQSTRPHRSHFLSSEESNRERLERVRHWVDESCLFVFVCVCSGVDFE